MPEAYAADSPTNPYRSGWSTYGQKGFADGPESRCIT